MKMVNGFQTVDDDDESIQEGRVYKSKYFKGGKKKKLKQP